MWPTFKTQHPVHKQEASEREVRLASLAFGFTIGFGWFVVWHAIKQTKRARKWSPYIIMCWCEIVVCTALGVICWLYLCDVIGYSFWFYFFIVTLWALQVQFLLQIIVSRICILLPGPSQKMRLKLIVAIWITAINISVYCIWVPARLQISDKYIRINTFWDRTEKCLYLVTDGILNFIFIQVIRKRLVAMGLKKYDKLVVFNQRIIAVSLSMDVLIIGMMSYPNTFVYMQFHPLAYMVKLQIEMCMSRLIVKVASGTGLTVFEGSDHTGPSVELKEQQRPTRRTVDVHISTEVVIDVHRETLYDENIELEQYTQNQSRTKQNNITHQFHSDTESLSLEKDQIGTRTAHSSDSDV